MESKKLVPRKGPLERRDLMNDLDRSVLAPKRQCTATSKRTGERCKNYCGAGLRTCRFHGRATKTSKIAAAKRIADASGYAADMLVEFMADPKIDVKQRTSIAQDLLSRAGYNGKTELVVEMPAWEQAMISRITTVDYTVTSDDGSVLDAEVVEEDAEQLALYGGRVHDDAEEDRMREEESDRRKWLKSERRSPQAAPQPKPKRLPDPPQETEDYEAHPSLRRMDRAEQIRRANAPETAKLRPRRQRGQ